MDQVPPAGTMVKLALTANMSTGGISIDRTTDAHPDNIEQAYKRLRSQHHPDRDGGSADEFHAVEMAWEQYLRERSDA